MSLSFPFITPTTAPRLAVIGQLGWPFISAIAWSADGRRLAVSSARGVGIWQDGFGGPPDQQLAVDVPIKDAAFSPDGMQMATAAAYAFIDRWDAVSGAHLGQIQPSASGQAAYDAVAWHGDRLAFGGVDRRVYVWDLRVGRLLHALDGHTDEVTALAFTPDGRTLISGGWDARVRLWDTQSGALIAVLAMLDWVRHVAVSGDGRWLGATGKDGTVRLWELSTRALRHTLDAHSSGADCIAFNHDSAACVTGGRDGTVRLWNVQDGTALVTLAGHDKPVLAAAFHPAGHLLATGGGDNVVRLWAVR